MAAQHRTASQGSDPQVATRRITLVGPHKECDAMKILSSLSAAFLLAWSSLAWAAVDVNSADAKTLESLNGVGPAKAAAIVEYRTKNGAFKSVDDLEKVPGIGNAIVKKNRDNLTVGGKPAAKPVAAKDAR
jgi:competence protein ComEA